MKIRTIIAVAVLAVAGLMTAVTGRSQTSDTFTGAGGRCTVSLTSNYSKSTSYKCGNVPVFLNGEGFPTHHVGFSVVVTNGVFNNGSFVLTDNSGNVVFVASNWMGTVAADGTLNGTYSGTLPDGNPFLGTAQETVSREKVQTYRLVSYIFVVKTGTGSFSTN